MTNRKMLSRTTSVSAALLLASAAGAQVNFPEVEPNDAKAGANLFTMACGDTISGNTTGTSTTVAGPASADTFRIRTISTGVPVLYTLTMSRADNVLPVNTLTIRGLNQVAGVPGATDSTVNTAVTSGTTKVVSWYGTGPVGADQDIYVRVTGTTATTIDYALTLTCSPVTLNTVPGNAFAGNVTVRPDAATDTAIDTDYWVYDSNFNAIPNYGHDDVDGTGVVRALGAGTYHAALGNYNTCNNLGSPTDDTFRTGIVLDFPNVLANVTTGALGTMNFRVTDGINDNTGLGSRSGSHQVAWHTFTVVDAPFPTGSGVATPAVIKQGDSTLLTVAVNPVGGATPSTGITVTGNLSSMGGSGSQAFFDNGTNGDVTAGDNTFSYLFTPTGYGSATLPFTVADAEARSSNGNITLNSRQVIDLGTLAVGTTTPPAVDLAAGEIKFYKFTLTNPISVANTNWLDVSNPAPVGTDSEIGIYRATDGGLEDSDDQDGDNSLAALSYGQTTPTRPGTGNGVVNNGRDGSLAAGTYYMAIGMFNVTFGANFAATSTGPAATGFQVALTLGQQNDPAIVGNPSSGAVGGTALLTANVTPGINPPSATLAVTGNLTNIGGSASQTFYDNGTNGDVTAGDNVFSYLATIPHAPAQGAGAFNCPVSVIDDQNRTGNGSITVTLAAEATGNCCTAGACSIATAFNCSGGGGTYGGDGTNCGAITYTFGNGSNAFTSIAGTGTLVTAASDCDDCSSTVALPFAFNLFENTYNSVFVHSNGYLQFGATSNAVFTNTPLPTATAPNNLVAPLWDDFDTSNATGFGQGDIYTQVDGSAPNRTFTVQWNNVTQYQQAGVLPPTSETFQVILYEGTHNVEFRYGSISPINTTGTGQGTGQDASGGDASIGVENATGSAAHSIPSNGFTGQAQNVTYTLASNPCVLPCGTSDYNGDGDFGTDADIEAFFACLAGNCCPTCYAGGSDFNADGDFGTDADIESFFRVLAGGPC